DRAGAPPDVLRFGPRGRAGKANRSDECNCGQCTLEHGISSPDFLFQAGPPFPYARAWGPLWHLPAPARRHIRLAKTKMPHLRTSLPARSRRQRAPHPVAEPSLFGRVPPLPKFNPPAPALGPRSTASGGGRAPQIPAAVLF